MGSVNANFTELRQEMTELRQEMDALAERVKPLERARQAEHADGPINTANEGQLWALNALQARLADHPSTLEGAVMLVGSLTLPDGTPVAWQQSAGTADILETDWSEQSAAFAALGHPVRLELLRHILSGVHATADLAEITSLGTTGQLHHHLRQLVAVGWVRQSGRGRYEVPPARVVPLIAALVGFQG